MKKVFIPKSVGSIPIQRQFMDKDKYVWGDFKFVFEENEEYDYLVVLDCLSTPILTKCPKENRFLFLGEPPYVKLYPNQYLSQFGNVFTVQPTLYCKGFAHKMIPVLPWMTGCSLKNNLHVLNNDECMCYKDFEDYSQTEDRLDKAILITSNKTLTIGHRQRVRFANRVINECVDFIDVFGNGYKHVDDKFDEMSKYKYAVIIENGQYKDYWTEKLADCILAGCYPIYCGAPNILDYFPNAGITVIDVNKYDDAINCIQECIASDMYEANLTNMQSNKQLILNEYNMFNLITNAITEHVAGGPRLDDMSTIEPTKFSFFDKVRNNIARRTGIII